MLRYGVLMTLFLCINSISLYIAAVINKNNLIYINQLIKNAMNTEYLYLLCITIPDTLPYLKSKYDKY